MKAEKNTYFSGQNENYESLKVFSGKMQFNNDPQHFQVKKIKESDFYFPSKFKVIERAFVPPKGCFLGC